MLVTALGSLPGEDFAPAVRHMLTHLPELAPLPELPARGATAQMIGRTLAVIEGLGFDLQPAGWRLTDHDGIDHQRATGLLRRDLDDWEEAVQGFTGTMKLSLAGPWTLTASVERPRGDRVLADHGARRDLAAALAEGAHSLVTELRRRVPDVTWVLQVDEPALPAVQQGRISTASGFSRHRSVAAAELSDALATLARRVDDDVESVAVHCCAPGLDLEVVRRAGISTVALDVGQLSTADLDALAAWVDEDRGVWWGVLDASRIDQVPRPDHLAERWLAVAERLGHPLPVLVSGGALTPSCGLAGWSSGPVTAALRALREAADLVEERLG
ncbi:uroporphyrinogen decarboxylase/cobalamine-independent methonine synthase family protein [Aestuariimicrobium ganziense]|uniref:methionine synthase n=1 Tax=Aestuariimicrobium ganziense TaxID=2773677 RepID=UPI0019410648|nr:methionine synthase [Aestuariimicrobium ganziense]